ncbi:MAG: hypothetical protein AB7K36_31390 [Chloroflexota bacterium]
MTIMVDPPRALTCWERSMLEALLAEPLHGNDELRRQIDALRVSERYSEGDPTVIFTIDKESVPPASVTGMGLEERCCLDADGMAIHVLLHAVDGYLWELEIVRMDGGPLLAEIDPSALQPILWRQVVRPDGSSYWTYNASDL